MKTEQLKELGLTDEQIAEVMKLNGIAVTRATDSVSAKLQSVEEKLKLAESSLKAFDGVDVEKFKGDIKTLEQQLSQKDADYQKKLYDIEYDTALKDLIGKEKFSSEYAKHGVMGEIKAKGLKFEDGKILGYDDMLKAIKAKEPAAFTVEAKPDGNPNKVVIPPGNGGQGGDAAKPSLTEMMKLANTNPAQTAAIISQMPQYKPQTAAMNTQNKQ